MFGKDAVKIYIQGWEGRRGIIADYDNYHWTLRSEFDPSEEIVEENENVALTKDQRILAVKGLWVELGRKPTGGECEKRLGIPKPTAARLLKRIKM